MLFAWTKQGSRILVEDFKCKVAFQQTPQHDFLKIFKIYSILNNGWLTNRNMRNINH